MASFRMLPFTFLLLNVLSDIKAGGNCSSSPKPIIAELGKGIMIKCKNNEPILVMGLRYCPLNKNNCTSKGQIRKQNGTFTNDETTLEIHSNMVFLSINQINISHEGSYILNYITENGMDELNISLEVFAPYTNPQVMKQEDTLICTASGGYPEEKLYWVSKAGTNLAHKSTSQSVINEDGSFNLSNTLQLESAPSETKYCCTFNNIRIPSRQPASACMALEHVRPSMFTSEETTLNMTQTIFIAITVILLVSILFAVLWRTRKKNYLLQKWQKLPFVNSSNLSTHPSRKEIAFNPISKYKVALNGNLELGQK